MRGPTDDAAAKLARTGRPSEAPLVAVVGDAAFDIHLLLEDAANTDEKLTATGGFRGLGGTGANAAAAIVRVGGRARLHATVGSDLVGRWIEGELARIGIDTAGVVRADGRSTVAVIVHRPDGRTVIVDRGVADAFGDLAPTTIGRGAVLGYLSAVPVSIAARCLEAAISPLVVGLEVRQRDELAALGSVTKVASILDRAWVILTNEAGAAMLADHMDRFRQTNVVVTRGAAGARLMRHGLPPLDIAAPAVEVVDATGAGDCFAGTLCRFLAVGVDIERAVRLATVAASLSTQAMGAQGDVPDETRLLAATGS